MGEHLYKCPTFILESPWICSGNFRGHESTLKWHQFFKMLEKSWKRPWICMGVCKKFLPDLKSVSYCHSDVASICSISWMYVPFLLVISFQILHTKTFFVGSLKKVLLDLKNPKKILEKSLNSSATEEWQPCLKHACSHQMPRCLRTCQRDTVFCQWMLWVIDYILTSDSQHQWWFVHSLQSHLVDHGRMRCSGWFSMVDVSAWSPFSILTLFRVATNLEYSGISLEHGKLTELSGNSVQPQGKIMTNKSFSTIEYLCKTAVDWVKCCCEISSVM